MHDMEEKRKHASVSTVTCGTSHISTGERLLNPCKNTYTHAPTNSRIVEGIVLDARQETYQLIPAMNWKSAKCLMRYS